MQSDGRITRLRRIGLVACLLGVLLAVGAARPSQLLQATAQAASRDLPLLTASVRSSGVVNGVVSPLGARNVLLASYLGADGETAKQLRDLLALPTEGPELIDAWREGQRERAADLAGKGATFSEALSVWMDPTYATFRQSYLNLLHDGLGATVRETDLTGDDAVYQINTWVHEGSGGLIDGVLEKSNLISRSANGSIDEPGLVTVQSAYFKAPWQEAIDWTLTSNRVFDIMGTTNDVPVPTLYANRVLPYAEDDALRATALAYTNQNYLMVLLMPKEPLPVEKVAALASPKRVSSLLARAAPRQVDLMVPLFDVALETSLRPGAEALGAARVFDPAKAQLDGMLVPTMAAYRGYLSDLRQTSRLVVNEDGSEGASETAASHYTIGCSAAFPGTLPATFHALHPFLFLVVHPKTGSVPFAGWIGDPSQVPYRPTNPGSSRSH